MLYINMMRTILEDIMTGVIGILLAICLILSLCGLVLVSPILILVWIIVTIFNKEKYEKDFQNFNRIKP